MIILASIKDPNLLKISILIFDDKDLREKKKKKRIAGNHLNFYNFVIVSLDRF